MNEGAKGLRSERSHSFPLGFHLVRLREHFWEGL